MIKENEIRSLDDLLVNGLSYEQKRRYLVSPSRNRQRYTKGLFWEWGQKDISFYTFSDCRPFHYHIKNGKVKYDINQLYLGLDDNTEFEFISKFMWDALQWDKISNTEPMKKEVERLRAHLKHKKQSELVSILERDALDPHSKTNTASAKYLLDRLDPRKAPRGRPPKKEQSSSVSNTPDVKSARALEASLEKLKEFHPQLVVDNK